MRIENSKLILERRECLWCRGTRLIPGKKPCATCHGTGKGTRGKENGCRECHGYRTATDFINMVSCTTCTDGTEPETLYHYAPDSIWQSFRFVVYRENRRLTWGESYIAHGLVFSCTDYGAAYRMPDDAVIDEVKTHKGHQACKFTADDGTLADHIAIIVTRDGYSVDAVFLKQASVVKEKELTA